MTAGPLPMFLPEPDPAEAVLSLTAEVARLTRARDAAVADLQHAHSALDQVGVPRRLGPRPATVEGRVRALLTGLEVSRPTREALASLGRGA